MLRFSCKQGKQGKGLQMFIGNSAWIGNASDFEEFAGMIENGARLASGLIYTHVCKDDNNDYFCFKPTDTRVDGRLYVTAEYLTRVLDLAGVTVTLGESCPIQFTPVNIQQRNYLGQTWTYYTYHKDKRRKSTCFTMIQYRAASPYSPLLEILLDESGKEAPYYLAREKWHATY